MALEDLRRYWGHVEFSRGPKFPLKKFNLIVAQEPSRRCGLPAYALSKAVGSPWVCEVHGEYLTAPFLSKQDHALAVWLLRRASAVRAVNRKIEESLKNIGVRNVIFAPAIYIKTEVFRPTVPAGERSKTVLFVGRLSREKGFDLLLESFSLVAKEMPDARLQMVGSGSEETKIRSKIDALGLGKSVTLSGSVPHEKLVAHYGKASMCVSTSFFEGGPRTIFEACSCGTSFVSTKTGIISEVAKDGREGFFVDRAPSEVANRILKLLCDRSLREKMGKNARRLVVENFEWESSVKGYANAYIDLVKRLCSCRGP